MSAAIDNEELIDYEEDQDVSIATSGAPAAAASGGAAGASGEGDKKSFTGIHSTGFRFVFHAQSRAAHHSEAFVQ